MLETLLSQLSANAPDHVSVPILQPTDPFLETAGEDLRRRIFITETSTSASQCLRPEFTIPICLAYAGGAKRYAYGGMVFRQSRAGGSEFEQVGIEDLGNEDTAAADADCIADMVNAVMTGAAHLDKNIVSKAVILGDQNLFAVVVDGLQLPPQVARRLMRVFGDRDQINRVLIELTTNNGTGGADSTAYELARAGDEAGLIDHVSALMDKGNLSAKSGRAPAHIAKRMIAKIADANFRLSEEQARILREFLALECPLVDAEQELIAFAQRSNIEFGATLTDFTQRLKALEPIFDDLDAFVYRASFGRKLDYYTGLLFDVEINGVSVGGGGRYDRLCTLLGHEDAVPAVGFSIALDRLAEALA